MRKDLCWQLLWIPALKAGRSLEGFRIDSHISKGAVLKPCYQKDMFFLRTKEFKNHQYTRYQDQILKQQIEKALQITYIINLFIQYTQAFIIYIHGNPCRPQIELSLQPGQSLPVLRRSWCGSKCASAVTIAFTCEV